MNKKNTSIKVIFLISIIFFSFTPVSAAQWEVGTGQTYTTIQSAVDNANTLDDDIINVHSGNYAEDVIIYKKLMIQANKGDDVELKPVNTGFTVVNDGTGDGSGSTIDGFQITNSPGGTGVNISAANCTVKNNVITGGKTGITVSGGNTTILDNIISYF